MILVGILLTLLGFVISVLSLAVTSSSEDGWRWCSSDWR